MVETWRRGLSVLSRWGLPVVVTLLCGVSAVSLVQLSKERQRSKQLAADNQTLNATLGQVQNQLQAVSDRLNTLSANPRPRRSAARRAAPAPAKPTPPQATAADRRLDQIQSRLNDQQKEIATTRQELNGSIARTHEELAALQKRGERNYYEFQLDRSKEFRRFGPVTLSLRKANLKRKTYDLAMVVEDQQLQKKSVNVYEPVWITLADKPEPVQLVVNEIHKDQVKGYVSEPRYKKSELAARVTPADNTPGLRRR